MADKSMHIGIVRLSAIGDAVLLVPTIRALQAHYPQARISWLTTPLVHSLLEGLSGVDFVLINKPAKLGDYLHIRRALREVRFDALLCPQASLRTNLLYGVISADRKIGFDDQRARDGHKLFINDQIPAADHHLVDGFLAFAAKLGANTDQIRWDLPLTDRALTFAKTSVSAQQQSVAINPVASKAERSWPPQRYVELINRIPPDIQVLLTGGSSAAEFSVAAQIVAQVRRPVDNFVGKTNLQQLAACLSQVNVLVAPDTGPVHIANAFNVPVVGQYAVARPELSGPYGNLQHTVNCYPEAVEKFLGIPAAQASWHQRVHHLDAMKLISVDAVMAKLSDVLEQ